MNRRLFGAFGVLAAVALAGASCKSDPLSGTDGTPAVIVPSFSYLQMSVGDTTSVTAQVLDARTVPLDLPITFTACTNDITVTADSTFHPIPRVSARAKVRANSANPSCIKMTSGGVTDSVKVAVLPQGFGGAFSATTAKGGDTLKIASTTLLKFDTATVSVSFGTAPAPIVAKSADNLTVLVPFGAAGPATITGINVTYVPGLIVTLPSTATVTQTGDFWAPGDTGYASAPAINLPTATGQSTVFLSMVPSINNDANCAEGTASGATGNCTIFKYTANGTDSLQFTTNWTPATTAADASDIDTYSCGSAGVAACFEDGGAGATAKTPEKFSFKPSAGTHYFVLEQFSTGEDPNIVVTITKLN
jgi:hypothetical protein